MRVLPLAHSLKCITLGSRSRVLMTFRPEGACGIITIGTITTSHSEAGRSPTSPPPRSSGQLRSSTGLLTVDASRPSLPPRLDVGRRIHETSPERAPFVSRLVERLL